MAFAIAAMFGNTHAANAQAVVDLAWSATSDTNITGYVVSYGVENQAPTNLRVGKVFGITLTNLQVGTPYYFYVKAHDDSGWESESSPVLHYTTPVENHPPLFAPVPNTQVVAGTLVQVELTATDTDEPAQRLSYTLASGPAGAVVDGLTGLFTWTATQAGTYPVTVRVTDDGTPALSATTSFSITVTNPPLPQVWVRWDSPTVTEGAAAILTVGRQRNLQADLPISLNVQGTAVAGQDYAGIPGVVMIPSGLASVTVNVGTTDDGRINGARTLVVAVTAGGAYELLSGEAQLTIADNDVNRPPVLPPVADQAALAGTPVQVQLAATDTDEPAQRLSYTLDSGPAGAVVDGLTGLFTWTATQAGTYLVTVRVTDDGTPALSATTSFSITVTNAQALTTPQQFSAETSGSQRIAFSWVFNDGPADGFEFEYSLDGVSFLPYASVGGAERRVTFTAPSPYPVQTYPYRFRMRAARGSQRSEYTPAVTAITNVAKLTITSVSSSPLYAGEGEPVAFSALVKNIGRGYSLEGETVRVLFFVDDTGPVAWGETRQAIPVNGTVTVTASDGPDGTGTWLATPGGHTLFAVIEPNSGGRSSTTQLSTNTSAAPFMVAGAGAAMVGLHLSASQIGEGSSAPVILTLARDGSTAASLKVNLLFSGTAVAGLHYVPIPDAITIPAGLASVQVSILPLDNYVVNPARELKVQLVPSLEYTANTASSVALTLLDNDRDEDGDGLSDDGEALAGTQRKEASSVLKILSIQRQPDGSARVTWQSVPGINYQVMARSGEAVPWTPLSPVLSATGAVSSAVVPTPAWERVFFSVAAVRP